MIITFDFFFVPVSMLMGLLVFGLAAKWYYLPWARRRSLRDAATPILLLHATRYIGLGFLVTGLVSPLLDQTFAKSAAYGDFVAACLAFIALYFLRRGAGSAKAWLWLFSVAGVVDLITAVGLGITHIKPATIDGMYFIPVLGVPLLFASHVALMVLLFRSATSTVRESGDLLPQKY